MADYLVTDTELTSVANAIRTKGGTSANLSFPTEFVSAINAISGGGGLEYEEGTFTPTSDTASNASGARFMFTNSHSAPPDIAIMSEVGATQATDANSITYALYVKYSGLFGDSYIQNMSSPSEVVTYYRRYGYRLSSGSVANSESTSTNTAPFPNELTKTYFRPAYSSSRYIRSGKMYKWIAIWK